MAMNKVDNANMCMIRNPSQCQSLPALEPSSTKDMAFNLLLQQATTGKTVDWIPAGTQPAQNKAWHAKEGLSTKGTGRTSGTGSNINPDKIKADPHQKPKGILILTFVTKGGRLQHVAK